MKLYFIAGKARHGKDTLAEFMKKEYESQGKKVCIVHISGHIKHLIREYFGWDGKEETKPRTLLQELGTDVVRVKMNRPLLWIQRTLEDLDVLAHFFDVAIIADVRLPIEIEQIKSYMPSSTGIHIVRELFESSLSSKEQQHITETALDAYEGEYDYEVLNTTLEQLEATGKEIVRNEEVKDEKND